MFNLFMIFISILLVSQQTLLQLEESRALLGALLDHRAVLQAEPWFSTWVRPAGGALELRWKSVYRHTEQEILLLRNIQESRSRWARFSISSQKDGFRKQNY